MIEILQVLLAIAAGVILIWRAEPAINRMSSTTPVPIRLAYVLIVLGAAGLLLRTVLSGQPPNWPSLAIVCGVAALFLFCRRFRGRDDYHA